jgi:GT2 family glycosyltransferase/SAM-dependent methyltransferase
VKLERVEAPASELEAGRIRLVSVMAPMWNEAGHIEELVADLAAQDFEGEVELLVADGGSTDGSVERLRDAAERHGVAVTVLDNPDRWVSHALNLCIGAARGDLIVRVDCHSRYPTDYLRRCVEAAEETGAANVGGNFVPRGRTPTERAVACAMDSPFGGIHWTRHGPSGRVEVDTVPYGAFRPEAFRRAGLFDETLVRNQDDEFNLRLRLAGGRVVLDPSIRIFYTPRRSFRKVFRQYYEYGFWKPVVMRKHGRVVSARSLVPGAFVASVAVLAPLAPWLTPAAWLLGAELTAYAAGALAFGSAAVRRRRESWALLPRVLAAFPTFHVGYGLGTLAGLVRAMRARGSGGSAKFERVDRSVQTGSRAKPASPDGRRRKRRLVSTGANAEAQSATAMARHPVSRRVFHVLSFRRAEPPRYDDDRFRRRFFGYDVESTRRFFARFEATFDVAGKSVLDVGCGRGAAAIEAARRGAARVVGIDLHIPPQTVRMVAEDPALAGRVELVETAGALDELGAQTFDVVLSKDSFEHYADPESFVFALKRRVQPGGVLAIGFGPLWRSPTGGHIEYMTPLPWAHLLFPEEVLMAERRRFRPDDGARTFGEVAGGLNKMTLARFEAIMASSGLERISFAVNVSDNPVVKAMKVVSRLPGLGELFTTNVYGVWRKPA